MSYTFFGIQVAIKAFHKDPLRQRLHEAIAESAERQSLQDKRAFWKRIAAILNEAMPVFEYGFWDLIREDHAETEFETWCSEIEGSVATEQEEMGAAADEVNRLSADKTYVLATLLFLVERDSNSDLTLGERCDLPESAYFTRATFATLMATIPMLNFSQRAGRRHLPQPRQRGGRPVRRGPARRRLRILQAPGVNRPQPGQATMFEVLQVSGSPGERPHSRPASSSIRRAQRDSSAGVLAARPPGRLRR